MCRDPQVVVADHLTTDLEGGAHCSVGLASLRWQLEHGRQTREFVQLCHGLLAELALLRPIAQFTIGNHRDDGLAGPQSLKPSCHLRRPLPSDVDADVGVQKNACLHLETFPLLRGSVLSTVWEEVVRHVGKNVECSRQSLPLLTQRRSRRLGGRFRPLCRKPGIALVIVPPGCCPSEKPWPLPPDNPRLYIRTCIYTLRSEINYGQGASLDPAARLDH